MQVLSQVYLDRCPVQDGFRLRGSDMTRIEVFVDAAFAFAVTLLVISFDEIPRSYDAMVAALKGVPAFVIAVAQLVWIWWEHNVWSRRYGLEDAPTVVLSAALLIVVLVYIYPLRVMAEGMFFWFTGGYLPSSFRLESIDELRFMFVFLGTGFTTLCALFWLMYAHAMRRADLLRLSAFERHETRTIELVWLGFGVIGLTSVSLALMLPSRGVPFAGFAYFLLSLWGPLIARRRRRSQPPQTHG